MCEALEYAHARQIIHLILERLTVQLVPAEVDSETVEEIESLHRDVMRARDPLTAG